MRPRIQIQKWGALPGKIGNEVLAKLATLVSSSNCLIWL